MEERTFTMEEIAVMATSGCSHQWMITDVCRYPRTIIPISMEAFTMEENTAMSAPAITLGDGEAHSPEIRRCKSGVNQV